MDRLGIGFLSVFALPPVELVDLAADLGCHYISTVVQGQPLVPLDFGPYSLRDDVALRRDVQAAMEHRGVTISLGDGFLVLPGAEMRSQAGDLDVRDGTATATGLAGSAFDLVTAFQAFHWFANAQAADEFARILRPGGRLALVWNLFERSESFMDEFGALHERFAEKGRIAGLGVDEKAHADVLRAAGFGPVRRASFVWTLEGDFALLLGRARSSSTMPRAGPNYDAMVRELHDLHARYADAGGFIPLTYRTDVFLTEKPL